MEQEVRLVKVVDSYRRERLWERFDTVNIVSTDALTVSFVGLRQSCHCLCHTRKLT